MTFEVFKGVDPGVVVLAAAGALGGVHRWFLVNLKDDAPWPLKIVALGTTIASGIGTALLFGPLLAPLIPAAIHAIPFDSFHAVMIDAQTANGGGGFLAGLLGIGIAGWLIDFTSELRRLSIKRAKNGGMK